MRHFTAIITLLFCTTAGAQTFSGTVAAADSASAIPLAYATVYLPALHQGTMTDADGRFRVDGLPAGRYAVEYSCVGYATRHDTIDIAARPTSLASLAEQARTGTSADVVRHVTLDVQAIRLPEVVVGSTDENPALYVIRRMGESNAANMKRLRSLHASVSDDVSQNLSTIPDKIVKAVRLVIWMTPYRKLFNLFMAHPELTYSARYDITYDGKRERQTGLTLTRCTPALDAADSRTLLKLFEADVNTCLYFLTERKERAVHPSQWDKYDWELRGTYDEGGRTVDVVRCTYKDRRGKGNINADFHIIHLDEDPATAVAGVTHALLRVQSKRRTVEFREVAPSLFLPVSDLITLAFDADDRADIQQSIDERRDSIAHADMSNRRRAKQERKIAEGQQMADDIVQLWVKTASSLRYSDVVVR